MAFFPTQDLVAKPIENYVWDAGSMAWVKETQPGGGGGGGTSSSFAAAFPGTGTAAGFKDAGGNMAAGLLDASGFLKVNVAAGGAGGGAVTVADGADVAEGTTTDAAWSSGAGTVISLLKKIASAGGSAVSIADGSDVAEGTTTDAAVVTDANGTISGKLRGLVKLIASVISGGAVTVSGTVTTTPPADASTNITKFGGSAVTLGQQVAGSSMPVILPSATITTLTPPAAITGFALEAGHLATIDSHIPALGQALAAASVPVILPSATVTTLTPPSNTGYALDSSLSTIDTDLKSNITLHAGSNIVGKVTTDQTTHGTTDLVAADITKFGGSAVTIGQQVAGSSIPVILPSATISTLTPPAAITGFALEAGHLATIDSHIPALGQALAAASIPVILPSATISTLTPPAAITGFALDSTVAKDASLTTVNTNLTTLDTDLKATQPRSITNFPVVGSVEVFDGQTVVFGADWASRRLLEASYLQEQAMAINAMFASESENSQRMGFEIR